jgi:hypothetical protein
MRTNPEHIYAFSRTYLEARLRELGFDVVSFQTFPLLGSGLRGSLASAYLALARLLHRGPAEGGS